MIKKEEVYSTANVIIKERIGRDVWRPILGICALHLTHPCAHTHSSEKCTSTHTHHEHTHGAVLAQGSHLSRGIEGVESAGHSLPPPTIPAGPETRTRDLQVTSPTLSIRPRLPQN